MPWSSSEAHAKTHKARSPHAKRVWAKIANSVLQRTGNDASAIKIANSVIAKQRRK